MFVVLVITYNRIKILRETMSRLSQYLNGSWEFVIADDGSTDGTQEMIKSDYPDAALVQSFRARLGGNTNAGLKVAFSVSDVVLQVQDDYYLMNPLDVRSHIEELQSNEDIGWIRLGNVANHNLHAAMHGDYWHVAWDSPGLYVSSDQPHIKHKRFHDAYGWYPEGLPVTSTENTWCAAVKNAGMQRGSPRVAVPVHTERGLWWHAGDGCSYNQAGL